MYSEIIQKKTGVNNLNVLKTIRKEEKFISIIKKSIAEFIGTFVLVFVACGVAAVTGCSSDANAAYILTALAFGGVIIAMAYSIGNISGCHINPAVSLAVLINKGMSAKDFIFYVLAQFAGALTGSAALMAIIGTDKGLGANALYEGDIIKSLSVEIILTFIFVLTILGVTSKKENSKIAGLVIGGSLTLVHLFGIYFTGTSVNPARSFAPAVILGGQSLESVWVFIVGPILGAVLAAIIWRLMKSKEC